MSAMDERHRSKKSRVVADWDSLAGMTFGSGAPRVRKDLLDVNVLPVQDERPAASADWTVLACNTFPHKKDADPQGGIIGCDAHIQAVELRVAQASKFN